MSPETSEDIKKGDKAEQILAAALSLYTVKGSHATSMDELAQAAGVAAGTVYRYFASKEVLVNALFHHWNKAYDHALFHDYPWADAPREQFSRYWRRNARFARAYPEAYLFLEAHWNDPYLDEDSKALVEEQNRRGEFFFSECRRLQITKDVSEELIHAIICGAFTRVIQFWRHGRLELTDEVIKQAEICCWEAIRR